MSILAWPKLFLLFLLFALEKEKGMSGMYCSDPVAILPGISRCCILPL